MAEVDSIGTERMRAARGRRPVAAAQSGGDGQDGFLGRVIDMLSHHERMALRLRHRDGLEPAAIAARMNLPESIVADLIKRAELTIRAAQLAFIEALAENAPQPAR